MNPEAGHQLSRGTRTTESLPVHLVLHGDGTGYEREALLLFGTDGGKFFGSGAPAFFFETHLPLQNGSKDGIYPVKFLNGKQKKYQLK